MHAPPVFKNLTNPNISLHPHVGINGGAGSSSTLRVENPSPIFSHGISSMAVVPNGSRSGAQTVKKMRGRPRKYVLDRAGNMSLGLTPVCAAAPSSERIFGGESTKEAAAWHMVETKTRSSWRMDERVSGTSIYTTCTTR